MKNNIIIITGQTACGKSDYSLNLAKKIRGIIINSDAMQIYKETPILSASPTKYDNIKHVLYNIISGDKIFCVQEWIFLVKKEIQNAISQNLTPIIVGGSPMYNRILIDGINEIPDISEQIKKQTQNLSNEEIYKELTKIDPLSCNIDKNNTHRLLRAYQVFLQTGLSIYSFYNNPKKSPLAEYNIDKRLIKISKEQLHKNCELRFSKMIESGAIEEVKKLYMNNYPENSMIFKTIGVKEIKQYLDGLISLDEATYLATTKTKQYAKKQATWFNNKFQDFTCIL